MKKELFMLACLIAANFATAKTVMITVQPAPAKRTAQVYERGNAISGSNGIFSVEIGLL